MAQAAEVKRLAALVILLLGVAALFWLDYERRQRALDEAPLPLVIPQPPAPK